MRQKDILLLAVCVVLFFQKPAHAYVDPSVMTYTVQTIAAAVIGMGAVVGLLWRRAMRNAKKVLNIDENAGKEVEDDVVILKKDETTES